MIGELDWVCLDLRVVRWGYYALDAGIDFNSIEIIAGMIPTRF